MSAAQAAAGTPELDALDRGLRRVAALAESGFVDEYLVYENRGSWTFAGGMIGRIILRRSSIDTVWAGSSERGVVSDSAAWTGSAAEAMQNACSSLPVDAWTAFGWVSFDFALAIHGVPISGDNTSDDVLAYLTIPRFVVEFGGDLDTEYRIHPSDAAEREAVETILASATEVGPSTVESVDVSADLDDYRARAAAAVEEISRGHYSKVILSRTVEIPFVVDLPATYRAARLANTPARSFLLDSGGIRAAGLSPELVMKVDGQGMVTAEPLAGTRAFGKGDLADSAARIELENDPKEIAEHAVSVRTAFQEVQSVARVGTTGVDDFMAVRERGSVQHLASTVTGRLREDLSPWDAFAALFPAVTASGIPKKPAVEAIHRLERSPRDLYSGAVVSVGSDGSLEAALVLRAVYERDGNAWLRAGAGIVGQSEPDREFEETCEKFNSIAPYLVRRPTLPE